MSSNADDRGINFRVGVDPNQLGSGKIIPTPLDPSLMRQAPDDASLVRRFDVIESDTYNQNASLIPTRTRMEEWLLSVLQFPFGYNRYSRNDLSSAFAFDNASRFPTKVNYPSRAEMATQIPPEQMDGIITRLAEALGKILSVPTGSPIDLGTDFSDLRCTVVGRQLVLSQKYPDAHAFMPAGSRTLEKGDELVSRSTERGKKFAAALLNTVIGAVQQVPQENIDAQNRDNGSITYYVERPYTASGSPRKDPFFTMNINVRVPLPRGFRQVKQRFQPFRQTFSTWVNASTSHDVESGTFYSAAENELASLLMQQFSAEIQAKIEEVLRVQTEKAFNQGDLMFIQDGDRRKYSLDSHDITANSRNLLTGSLDGLPCLFRVSYDDQFDDVEVYAPRDMSAAMYFRRNIHSWKLFQVTGFNTNIGSICINTAAGDFKERPDELTVSLKIKVIPQEIQIDETKLTLSSFPGERQTTPPPAHYPIGEIPPAGDRDVTRKFQPLRRHILSTECKSRVNQSRTIPVFIGTTQNTMRLVDGEEVSISENLGDTDDFLPVLSPDVQVSPNDIIVLATYRLLLKDCDGDLKAIQTIVKASLLLALKSQIENAPAFNQMLKEAFRAEGKAFDPKFVIPILLCIDQHFEEVQRAFAATNGTIATA